MECPQKVDFYSVSSPRLQKGNVPHLGGGVCGNSLPQLWHVAVVW